MNISWHTGIKKILYSIIAIIGLFVGTNQSDVVNDTYVDNIAGAVAGVAGAVALIAEKKKDSTAAIVADYDGAKSTLWDAESYHNNVILPAASRAIQSNGVRFPWAQQVFYTAQEKCMRLTNNEKYWYLYSLSLHAFRAVWGMTWDYAVATIPEWRDACQGYDLRSHALHMGIGYYAIYTDVVAARERYIKTNQAYEITSLFVPDFAEYDYVKVE